MRHSFVFLLTAFSLFALGTTVSAAQPQLTVYTYEGFDSDWGPGPKVKAAFEPLCACTVKFVSASDGVALLTKMKLEGDRNKADIVLGLDTNLVSEARKTGLFSPHSIETSAVQVPGGFSDDTFVPFDYGHFAIVYDTEKVKNPPKSLKELVDGDPSEKLVIEDPRTSTPGLGLLLWVKSVYGDQAPAAWSKLKKRILTVTPGWTEAYGMFTKGEVPMVLSYTTSPAYHMIEEKSQHYQAASFSEGHYIQIEVAAISKASSQPDLARSFLQFMVSPAFQSIIPTTNWMMPAAKTGGALPPEFATLVQPTKTFLMSPDDVAKNRKAYIDEWLAAMSQ
jgi:thiamine transport system substrate-binding protein